MNSKIENRKSKISRLPLKLAILVIVIFGLLLTGMMLWKPMKVRYYAGKYAQAETPAERIRIVDMLCAYGESGKKALYDAFKKRCMAEQVKIPAGTLTLSNGSKIEIKSFFIDKFEVTKEKYHTLFLCSDFQRDWWPPDFKERNFPTENNPLLPVSEVLQKTAESYAKWLGMRLPTEYEWEHAARAGSTSKYCFGDNTSLLREFGWCESNSDGEPHTVGQKKPNNWGLYDVHGNVFEWCKGLHYHPPHRWFRNRYGNKYRHARGGSFNSKNPDIDTLTVMDPNSCMKGIGFRCVRDP